MLLEQKSENLVDPHGDDVDAVFESLVAELAAAEERGANPFLSATDRLAALEREESARFAERAVLYAELLATSLAEQGVTAGSSAASFDLALRSLAAELAIVDRLSDRTVQSRISEAMTLVEDFPITLFALECGDIWVSHARVIMAEGRMIADPARRADYESALVERAASVTPGRLRRIAQLAAQQCAEVPFQERHEAARAARSVRSYEVGDGMSEIVATVPTVLAVGVMDRLTQMGKAVKAANPAGSQAMDPRTMDPRTLDQLRTDLLCDLLLTGQASGDPHAGIDGIRAEVAILIPALTLLGEGDEPATILGKGPIGLDDALRMAAGAPSLVRLITDPVTEQILTTDNYRPTEALRRYLRSRDGRCRCPSCNRSVWRCDIDHTIPYSEGGLTEVGNLAHLCPGHHTIKHLPGWSVRQLEPGILEWTTPHGNVVVDRGDTPVRFAPTAP